MYCASLKKPKWATTVLELLLLGIIYAIAPPAWLRHLLLLRSLRPTFQKIYATIKETVASGNIKNQAILFTVISWIAAGIAFWMFADFADPGPTILRITFIGLAALTVPHMILIDGILNTKSKYQV